MMKHATALILFLLLFPPSSWAETYDQWVANCRSYKDVAAWLNDNFRYDPDRSGKSQTSGKTGRKQLTMKGREETFQYRTGGSLEASLFARETLNRINPDYRAEIIHLTLDRSPVHYLCGFHLGGRLFIMDYGNPEENLIGTHGPFADLNDYLQRFYLKPHRAPAKAVRCAFGMGPVLPAKPR
jgi:hypothetical protein